MLSNNNIEIIEEGIFDKTLLLRFIYLGNNEISEIRGAWKHLNIYLWNVQSNRLNTFDERIFKHDKMIQLDISNNIFDCGFDMIWTTEFDVTNVIIANNSKCNRLYLGKYLSMMDVLNLNKTNDFFKTLNCNKGKRY